MNTYTATIKGRQYTFNYNDVILVNRWHDMYGNPHYGVYLNNGEHLLLGSTYSFCPEYTPYAVKEVLRKKDL